MIGPFFQPLDLSPFGATGCTLYNDMRWVWPTTTDRGGDATVSIQVPDDNALFGFLFISQVAVVDPTANAFGWTTTNAMGVWVGGWQ